MDDGKVIFGCVGTDVFALYVLVFCYVELPLRFNYPRSTGAFTL